MESSGSTVQHPDLKKVENFLLSLPYVMDASAFISKGRLLAHVTVSWSAPVVPNSFRAECMKNLGLHQTPEEVFLIADRDLVA